MSLLATQNNPTYSTSYLIPILHTISSLLMTCQAIFPGIVQCVLATLYSYISLPRLVSSQLKNQQPPSDLLAFIWGLLRCYLVPSTSTGSHTLPQVSVAASQTARHSQSLLHTFCGSPLFPSAQATNSSLQNNESKL